jgi:hypothetical protein
LPWPSSRYFTMAQYLAPPLNTKTKIETTE